MHNIGFCALPGEVIFDIGANVGDKTDWFAKRGNRVVAVEPQPKLAAHLYQRFAENNLVQVVQKGVGAKSGTLTMSISENHTLSTFSEEWKQGRFKDETWASQVEVEITTLDALIAEYGKPRYIKIDVEGFEREVIGGLSGNFAAISVEFTSEFIERTVGIIRTLHFKGYRYFNLGLGDLSDFVFPINWIDAERMIIELSAICERDPLSWGDVYAC